MRWIEKQPVVGEKRIIRKFLLFPLLIEDEVRWLEYASIQQKRIWDIDVYKWINEKWADK